MISNTDPFAEYCAAEILNSFGERYVGALIDAGHLSSGPEDAVERLIEYDGVQPTRSGSNSKAIKHLREIIRGADNPTFAEMALIGVAPHTHWKPAAIIETYDAGAQVYKVGPNQPFHCGWPISFVFTEAGAMPYEWASESVPISISDLLEAYRIVAQASEVIGKLDKPRSSFPLGLSIHHRFKAIGAPSLYSTMEFPVPETGLAHVVPDKFSDRASDAFEGQVGWVMSSGRTLTDNEKCAAEYLEFELTRLPFQEGAKVFAQLVAESSARIEARDRNESRAD